MKVFHLIKKEWIEILRQREMLAVMLVAPILQTIVLGYVVTTDVKNIPVDVVNLSSGRPAARIVHRINRSDLFDVRRNTRRPVDAVTTFREGDVKAVIVLRDKHANGAFTYPEIQVLMDGINPNTAGIAAGYFNGIVKQYILSDLKQKGFDLPVRGHPIIRFNPDLESIHYMGPGIVALLLTIITMFLTSIALVREKEQQTLDTLRISRLTPFEIYLGKSLPMALLGLLEMGIGLVVVLLVFQIDIRGNVVYLFLAALIFLFSILSYSLLISTFCTTQQQALFFSWFSMVLFLLLSGLFTPVANIPAALRWLADINPLRYLIHIIREIFLKGNGPAFFYQDLLVMAAIAVAVGSLSLLNFRRMVSR